MGTLDDSNGVGHDDAEAVASAAVPVQDDAAADEVAGEPDAPTAVSGDGVAALIEAERQAAALLERRRAEQEAAQDTVRRIAEVEHSIQEASKAAQAERKQRAEIEHGLESRLEKEQKKLEDGKRALAEAQARIAEAEDQIAQHEDALATSHREGEAERKRADKEQRALEGELAAEREVHQRQDQQRADTEVEIATLQERLAKAREEAEERIAMAEGTLASLRGQPAPPTPRQVRLKEQAEAAIKREPVERAPIGERLGLKMKRGGKPFIDRPGACAVCQRTIQAGSAGKLANSGWIVRDEVGLCPSCQQDRWRLPEGATVPFRRFSESAR
jgi:hypothetical protein